jgi:hypothetical protein
MNKYYSFFNCNIYKHVLLDLFDKELKKGTLIKEKRIYNSVDPTLVMHTYPEPLVDLNYDLNENDVMLSSIEGSTGLHCNPGNNGLLIVPLSGALNFKFYSYSPPVVEGLTSFMYQDTTPEVEETLVETLTNVNVPIAFNGRMIHEYSPSSQPAIFYARKIPTTVLWEKVLERF